MRPGHAAGSTAAGLAKQASTVLAWSLGAQGAVRLYVTDDVWGAGGPTWREGSQASKACAEHKSCGLRAHADDACAPRLLMLRKDIFGKVWGYASSAYSFVAGAPAEAGPTPPPALRFFLAHTSSVSGSA